MFFKYHAFPSKTGQDRSLALSEATTEDLTKWANDPDCHEREECASILIKRERQPVPTTNGNSGSSRRTRTL